MYSNVANDASDVKECLKDVNANTRELLGSKVKDCSELKKSSHKLSKKHGLFTLLTIIIVVNEALQWLYATGYFNEAKSTILRLPCDIVNTKIALYQSWIQKCGRYDQQNIPELLIMYVNYKVRQEVAAYKGPSTMVPEIKNKPGNVPFYKPMAHVIGAKPLKNHLNIPNWDTGTTGTVIRQFYFSEPGQLIATVPGWYYVYSQIYFEKSNGYPVNSVSHTIYKEIPNNEHAPHQLLFLSTHSPNAPENSHNRPPGKIWEHSSFIGGIVKLRQAESVFVTVSDLNLLKQNPKANTFGVYFLDQL